MNLRDFQAFLLCEKCEEIMGGGLIMILGIKEDVCGNFMYPTQLLLLFLFLFCFL